MTCQDVRDGLDQIHRETGSWRMAGLAIGRSASCALRIVRGDLRPSADVVANWRGYQAMQQQASRPRRPTIAVRLTPADAALLDTLRQPGESRPAAIRRMMQAQSKPGRW